MAQSNSGWGQRHKEAHNKEQLATNKSRLDRSVIANIQQEEILARESKAQGLSAETANLIDDLLQEAATHIGKRYVLGTKGPSTFDCSGFSGYVYRQFGYTLGASSRDQYKMGKNVDRKDLRKGDLVFFTSRSSGKNVGHVGIVWEVDNEAGTFKFIHASVRGVRISDFEGYYVNRYIGARRVIE
ncbi:MAG: C40 family peptidase [Muribaculaceae bacterium]|nr:C40 family peptidase [Muribaculaceae bacterium]